MAGLASCSSRVALSCLKQAGLGSGCSGSECRTPANAFGSPAAALCSRVTGAVPLHHVGSSHVAGTGRGNRWLAASAFSTRGQELRDKCRGVMRAAAPGTLQEEAAVPGTSDSPFQVTYLEGNSWLWKVGDITILVDPVLVGNLDFGIPVFYDAGKMEMKDFQLEDLPAIDVLLITQGYDDHCHAKTLGPLSKMLPDLKVISSPNAEPILKNFYKEVTYLEPGDTTTVKGRESELKIRATPGPVLGPPWQRPENGYFLQLLDPKLSIYYEPHCIFNRSLLEKEEPVDVLLTPVIKQVLPGYTLVSGQEDAVELAKLLKPKYVLTMNNGELDAKGLLSLLVKQKGTTEEFKELLAKSLPNVSVLEPKPGIPVAVSPAS